MFALRFVCAHQRNSPHRSRPMNSRLILRQQVWEGNDVEDRDLSRQALRTAPFLASTVL
ncbi:hypothetical protein BDZ85DRAFT_270664, partial [Elsinoe ampelina]